MKVFASCSSYVLGQLFGPVRACELMTDAIVHPQKKPPCFAVEALRRLTKLADVTLRVDGGSSHIGKSRTRHFFDALQHDCDVWFSIDDDVNATAETLAWLLAAVDSKTPRVCIAPCVLRNGQSVNVEWSPIHFERAIPTGGMCRRATAGGFGLVAMNRPAIVAAARAAPSWRDEYDRNLKPAVFLESLSIDGVWTGEDISFFRRLPREVEVEALTTGKTTHAGCELSLEAVGL
jgi:hypothetical protein